MGNIKVSIILIMIFVFSISCGHKRNETNTSENKSVKTFKMVEIPPIIVDKQERTNYLVVHYWDNFEFSDTAYIHLPQVTEQAFNYYIELLHRSNINTVNTSVKKMLEKASENNVVFTYFLGLYEKYLWNPNSSFRNDILYEPVLEYTVNSDKIDEADRIRAVYRLELISKNKVGEEATDFYYTLSSGKEAQMKNIKADYLIVYFYNPDCFACKEITEQMNTSTIIKRGLDNKKIAILSFYSDEDTEAWENFQNQMPSNWINAYDKRNVVQLQELYDLKAIPTLYLLDKEKKVVMKDVDFQYLENYLASVL